MLSAFLSLLIYFTLAAAEPHKFDGAIAQVSLSEDTLTLDIPPNGGYAYVKFPEDPRIQQGSEVSGFQHEVEVQSDKDVTCVLSRSENGPPYDNMIRALEFGIEHFPTSQPLPKRIDAAEELFCYETAVAQPDRDTFTILVEENVGEGYLLRMGVARGEKYSIAVLENDYFNSDDDDNLQSTGAFFAADEPEPYILRLILFDANAIVNQSGKAQAPQCYAIHMAMGGIRFFVKKRLSPYFVKYLVDGKDVPEILCCAIGVTEEDCGKEADNYALSRNSF